MTNKKKDKHIFMTMEQKERSASHAMRIAYCDDSNDANKNIKMIHCPHFIVQQHEGHLTLIITIHHLTVLSQKRTTGLCTIVHFSCTSTVSKNGTLWGGQGRDASSSIWSFGTALNVWALFERLTKKKQER